MAWSVAEQCSCSECGGVAALCLGTTVASVSAEASEGAQKDVDRCVRCQDSSGMRSGC